MTYRYSPLTKTSKFVLRKFFPIPRSPYTAGRINDICSVHLVPPKRLRKFFESCADKLRTIKGPNIGDYLEFGVFNGSSMASMYRTAKKLDLRTTNLFGFDAFEGLPPEAELEDDNVWKKGFYKCSFKQMKECLRKEGVDPENINWIKGWYKDTLTTEAADRLQLNDPAIVFIDCDTYSSSKMVLRFVAPLISSTTIICLDDWKLNDLDIKGMGEYRAFNEFLEENPRLEARKIRSYNRKSESFLITLV